jgi:putative NADPH-quinone reductase
MKSKVLVILGHPNNDSYGASLARAYVDAARARGAEVRALHLGELQFNPVLTFGYRGEQALEPDLAAAQADLAWAEHLVWVYPIWWGGMPALLKGFIDRVFLPGFAFRYRKDSIWWDKLLQGKTAELIITLDTPPWVYRWLMGAPGLKQMKESILAFCGVKTRRVTLLGPIRQSAPAQREKWLGQVAARAGA